MIVSSVFNWHSVRGYARIFAQEACSTAAFVFGAIGVVLSNGVAVNGAQFQIDVILVAAAFALSAAVAGSRVYSHLNPAVSIGKAIVLVERPVLTVVRVMGQLGGSICGAQLLKAIVSDHLHGTFAVNAVGHNATPLAAFLLETVWTSALVYVVLAPNSTTLHPVAVIFCAHLFLVPLTACSLNPARSLGPSVAAGIYEDLWLFALSGVTGGVVGGLASRLTHVHEEAVLDDGL